VVQDSEGRWWAKHRETGEWNYYDGSSWIRGTPPGYEEVARETVTDGPSAQSSPTPHPEVERRENRWGRRPWLLVAGLAGVVALIAVVVSLAAGNAGGPETAEVPDVVGKPRSEAEKTLKSAGFEVQAEIRKSAMEDAGKVIRQSPSGGDVKKGSEVAIAVGEGPLQEKRTLVEKRSAPEEASSSTLNYRTFTDDTGAFSVQIPSGWEPVNDEGVSVKALNAQGLVVGREGADTAITAAPDVDAWENFEGEGTSIIVVKSLAQRFTDDQLIDTVPLLNSFSLHCATGDREDLDRPSYSGRVQTWNECNLGVPTYYTLSVSPEGRACAVIAQIGVTDEADRDAAKHILDTFEVDCGRATSLPLATPSASASSSASTSPKVTSASPT
jgi:hypothetical protein